MESEIWWSTILRFLFKSELRISAAETRNSDLDKDLKSTIVIQDM